jgi:hypothetical protein
MFRKSPVIVAIWWCYFTWPVYSQSHRAILLHPLDGFVTSAANDVSTTNQVGTGHNGSSTGPVGRHALLWHGSRESVVDLNPPGFSVTEARGAWENFQVGYGYGPATNNQGRALLWSGSAEGVVDLHPAGFTSSAAYDVFGNSQVGAASRLTEEHAMLWFGNAASFVDLHPSTFRDSAAYAIHEGTQVGAGNAPGSNEHALLWKGTAESVIDLHPAGFISSSARDVSGDIQVGGGRGPNSQRHALLWRGTAESVIDLHPADYDSSEAWGVERNTQVGVGWVGGSGHALLWHGTADSVVDLHSFLADLPVTIVRSIAQGVNARGDVVGLGFGSNGSAHALLWKAVPEPGTSAVCLTGLICTPVSSRRSARSRNSDRRQV